jgi:nucleotide-binding universal stress UspA family protein
MRREERGIDALVIGMMGRTGVSGLVIGNTSERVLESVECSILTVKVEASERQEAPRRGSRDG